MLMRLMMRSLVLALLLFALTARADDTSCDCSVFESKVATCQNESAAQLKNVSNEYEGKLKNVSNEYEGKMKNVSNEYEAKIANLQDEFSKAQEELRSAHAAQHDAYAAVGVERDAMKVEKEKISSECSNTVNQLTEQKHQKEKEIEKISSECSNTVNQLTEQKHQKEKEIELIRGNLAEAQAGKANAESQGNEKVQALQAQAQSLQQRVSSSEDKASSAESKLKSMQQALNAEKSQTDSLTAELKNKQTSDFLFSLEQLKTNAASYFKFVRSTGKFVLGTMCEALSKYIPGDQMSALKQKGNDLTSQVVSVWDTDVYPRGLLIFNTVMNHPVTSHGRRLFDEAVSPRVNDGYNKSKSHAVNLFESVQQSVKIHSEKLNGQLDVHFVQPLVEANPHIKSLIPTEFIDRICLLSLVIFVQRIVYRHIWCAIKIAVRLAYFCLSCLWCGCICGRRNRTSKAGKAIKKRRTFQPAAAVAPAATAVTREGARRRGPPTGTRQ